MESDTDRTLATVPLDDTQHQYRRCSSCSTIGYPNDIYCPQCGKSFGPACKHCGTVISHPVAVYCVGCGMRLATQMR